MQDKDLHAAPDPASALAAWRALVAKSLKGRDLASLDSTTRDGIVVAPLYARRETNAAPAGRGARAWAIIQPVDDPDPDRANANAHAAIAGGADGIALRFAGAPGATDRGLPATAEALAAALDGIDLAAVSLRLEPHAESPETAAWIADRVERSGIAPEVADIAFGLDPLAIMALGGGTPDPAAHAARFAALRKKRFRGPVALLDARVHHEAGATEAQELAAMLAGAVWWLRALEADGQSPADCLPLFGAAIAVDRDVWTSIAKLRAARMVWARLAELCGASGARLAIHAETGRRMLTRRDPYTNLLRNTLAAFAGGVGGVDSLAVLPHNAALGPAEASARKLALDIQHLLIDEAHVHRVSDPAAGSGALEALTEALAAKAWEELQAIEREGGIVQSLRDGAFPARVAAARESLRMRIDEGTDALVGVTLYPAADEPPPATASTPTSVGLAPVRLEELAGAA